MKSFTHIGLLSGALLLSGCSDQVSYSKGVYMLVDTSGTYTTELTQAQRIINFTLAKLNPGDTFVVARVDTGSFSEKDIIPKVTFNDRPSDANRPKSHFRNALDKFVKSVKPTTIVISGI